ncbi:MAG: hypothetical protein ACRDJC_01820 [Thermomicrobiales bacterium]
MSEDTERAGLGKVVYSVDESDDKHKRSKDKPQEAKKENSEVQEADEESFPASDPPGYAGGIATDPT